MRIEGNRVYKTIQQGDVTIEQYFDAVFHSTIEYIDGVLYVTIKNYLEEVLTSFNANVILVVNDDNHAVNIVNGVGTFGIVSDFLRVTTDIPDIRNGEYSLGEEPTQEDRIDELERAQADLIITLVEKGVL